MDYRRGRISPLLFGFVIALFSLSPLSAQEYSQETFTQGMAILSGATNIWDGSTGEYDDEFSDVSIGFPFNFYGKSYSSVRVSTNGYITFHEAGGGTLNGTDFSNDAIPSVTEPDGFIAPWWDDMKVINQGSIDKVSHLLEGTSPNRIFTVEWYSLTNYASSGSDWHYFQVKLYEGSDIIELHYGIWSDDGTESATVGIEKIDGSGGMDATALAALNTTLPSFNYRFTPVSVGLWSGGASSDWTDARNWFGTVPASTMDVSIPSGTTFSPKIISDIGIMTSLTIESGASLEVAASGVMETSGTTVTGLLSITGGTYNHYINISNSFQVSGTVTASSGTLNIGTPSTDYYADLTVYSGGSVNLSGATVNICDELEVQTGGTLNISGGIVSVCTYTGDNAGSLDAKFDVASGASFTGSGGTVKVNGAYSFDATYPAVRFSSGATISASGTSFSLANGQSTNESYYLDLQGKEIADLSIDTTGFSTALASALDCSSVTITNGTFDAGGYTISLSGNWTNNDSFSHGNNTVTFDGPGTQDIAGSAITTFQNLVLNTSAATSFFDDLELTATPNELRIQGDLSVLKGGFEVNSGAVLDVDGNVLISDGDAGIDADDGSITIYVGGNWDNNGTAIESPGVAGNGFDGFLSTVVFDGSGTQSLKGATVTEFHHLTISADVTCMINLSIDGTLTLAEGQSLAMDPAVTSMQLAGNWTNDGTFSASVCNVDFTGTTTLSGSNSLSLYSTTITGILRVGTINLSVTSSISLPTTGTLRLATGSSVSITPEFSVLGTLDVDEGDMTLASNLTIGGTADISGGTVTLPTVGSDCTVQTGGTLAVSGGTVNLPDGLYISGNFNLSGTGIVQNTLDSALFGDVLFQNGSGGGMTGGTLRVFNQFEAAAGTAWAATAGTIHFAGSAQSVDVQIQEPDFAIYHLVVEYGVLAQIMSTSTQPLDINGNVSIYSMGSIIPNSTTIEIAGNYFSEGTISGLGTITFDGTSNQTIDQNNFELGSANKTATFPHLTVNKSGTLTTVVAGGSGDRLTVTGNLTILSGTLDLDPASGQITHQVGGNLVWSGGSLQIDTAGDPDTGTAHLEIAGNLAISGSASFASSSSASAEINVGGSFSDTSGLQYHGILRMKSAANGTADTASINLASSSAIRFLELWPQSDGSKVDRWQITNSSTSIERVRIKRGILEIPSGGALFVADIEPDTTFNSSTAEGHIRFGLNVHPDFAKLVVSGGSLSASQLGASGTSTNDGSVVVTAGTLDVNGDFLFDNTNTSGGFSPRIQFTGGAISVAGDWTLQDAEDEDALEFSASGGTLTLDGSSGQSVTHQPEAESLPTMGTALWNLTIDNAAVSSPVTLLDNLSVQNLLTITDGTLRVPGKTLTLSGAQSHSIAPAGELDLEATGANNAGLVLADGASLAASGSLMLMRASGSTATATISASSSGGSGYGIKITSTGIFDANYFTISDLSSAGIIFEDGATVGCLHNGTLQRGSTTGSCLDFSAIVNSYVNRSRIPYAFNNIVFSNLAGEGTNVRTGMHTPILTFLGAMGSLAGEDYDEDPKESISSNVTNSGGVLWRNNEIEVIETGETFHTPELAIADPDTLSGHSLRPLGAVFLDQELDLATWGKDVILQNFFFAPREGYAVFNSDGILRGTLRNCTFISGRGVDRVTAENSTFFDPGAGVLAVTNSIITNCLYESGSLLTGSTQAFSSSAIAADFMDAVALDFHLAASSLHIDAGTDLTPNWSSVTTQVEEPSGIVAGATSITVVSTSGFPSKGWLSIDGDTIYYSSLSVGRFEEVSGVDVTHANGANIYQAAMDNEGNPRPNVPGGMWDPGADEFYDNGMRKVSEDLGYIPGFHFFSYTLGSLSSSRGYVLVITAGGASNPANNNRVCILDLDDMSIVASEQAVGPIVNMVEWPENTGTTDYLLQVYCIVDLTGDGKGNAIQLMVFRGATMNFHHPAGDPTSASTPVYDRRFGSDNSQGAWIFLPENGDQTYYIKSIIRTRLTNDGDSNADDGTGLNPSYNSPSGSHRSRWNRIFFMAYRATGTNTGGAIFKVNADPYDIDDNGAGNNRSYGMEIWNHIPGETGILEYEYEGRPAYTWKGVMRLYVPISGDTSLDNTGNPIRTGLAEIDMAGLSGSDPVVWARWGAREETLGTNTAGDYQNTLGARLDNGGPVSKVVYTLENSTVIYVRELGSQEGHEGILAASKVDKTPTTRPMRFWNTSFILFGIEDGVEALWLNTDPADDRNGVRVSTGQKLLPDGDGIISPEDYQSVPGTQDSEWPLTCVGSPIFMIWPTGNHLYFATDKGMVYKYGFDRYGTKIGNPGGVNAEVLQPGYPVCVQGRITHFSKSSSGLMISTDTGGFYCFE